MSRYAKGITPKVKPPVLPDIPPGTPHGLRSLLHGIRENLHLLNFGLSLKGDVTKLQSQVSHLNNITVNIDDGAVEAPTETVGVHVEALSNLVTVSWSPPIYIGHSYTEVFVQISSATNGTPDDAPNLTDDKLWTVSTGAAVTIPVPLQKHAGVYIWLRHVNRKGEIGALYTHPFTLIPMSAGVVLDVVGSEIDWSNLNTNAKDEISKATVTKALKITDGQRVTAHIENNKAYFDAQTFAIKDSRYPELNFTFAVNDSTIDGVTKPRVHMSDVVVKNALFENVKVTGTKTGNSYSTELENVHVFGGSKFSGEVDISSGSIGIGRFNVNSDGSFYSGTSYGTANFRVDKWGNVFVRGDVQANSLSANTIMVTKNHMAPNEVSSLYRKYFQESDYMVCEGTFYSYAGAHALFLITVFNNSDYYAKGFFEVYDQWGNQIAYSDKGRIVSKTVSLQTRIVDFNSTGEFSYKYYLRKYVNDYLMMKSDKVRITVSFIMLNR